MTGQQGIETLNRKGVRHIPRGSGETMIAVWAHADGPEVRKALRAVGAHTLPFVYLDALLDDPEIPERYKRQLVPGPRVPLEIVGAMLMNPSAPWITRDELLAKGRAA